VREGFFVRSPIKANGVTVGEADRRKYEDDYLRRQKQIDAPAAAQPAHHRADPALADRRDRAERHGRDSPPGPAARVISRLLSPVPIRGRQVRARGQGKARRPRVLRVEYYPANLFRCDTRRQGGGRSVEPWQPDAHETEMRRMMNKVRCHLMDRTVSHQIVKYTFNNVAFDFLPVQWLAQVTDVHASMTMSQPFRMSGCRTPSRWRLGTSRARISTSATTSTIQLQPPPTSR